MRKSVGWRRDPAILARLHEVEKRHLEGQTNTQIAVALGVEEITIRRDIDRLAELWRERIGEQAEDLRARAAGELDDIKRRSLAAAAFDEMAERAVLFDEAAVGHCAGDGTHRVKVGGDEIAPLIPCATAHTYPLIVQRDEKGSATFRGNKQGALNVARQAVMDRAKVLGIVVEKQEHLTPLPVRIYEVDVADGRSEGTDAGAGE